MSPAPRPQLTVAVPVYERTEGLERALASVLGQESPDGSVEVLVVDDASKVDVAALVRQWDPGSRVRFVRNDRNLGLCGNWNRCLELANGEILNVLHSDEVLSPGTVRRVLDAIERHPSLGMVCSGRGTPGVPLPAGPTAVGEVMKGVQPVSSVFVRRSALEDSGRFDPGYPYFPDLELYPRLASRHDVMFLENPALATAPTHSRHHMFSTWEKEDFLDAFSRVRELGYRRGGDSPEVASRRAAEDAAYSCRHIMWKSWRGGRSALARRYYRRARSAGALRIERAERLLYHASVLPLGARAVLACLTLRWRWMNRHSGSTP